MIQDNIEVVAELQRRKRCAGYRDCSYITLALPPAAFVALLDLVNIAGYIEDSPTTTPLQRKLQAAIRAFASELAAARKQETPQ